MPILHLIKYQYVMKNPILNLFEIDTTIVRLWTVWPVRI